MKRLLTWIKRNRVVLAAVALIVFGVVCWDMRYNLPEGFPMPPGLKPEPRERGVQTARNDLARGHYELQAISGPPRPKEDIERDEIYRRLLKYRYSVEVNYRAGDLVSAELLQFIDGYNSVTKPEILKKFGKDIFLECDALAQATVGKK